MPRPFAPLLSPRRASRFALIGVLATIVHVTVARALAQQAVGPELATFGGFATALFVSFFGHSFFTFETQPSRRRFLLFVTASGLAVCAAALVSRLLVNAGLQGPLAVTLAAVVVPITSYVFNTLVTFRERHARQEHV